MGLPCYSFPEALLRQWWRLVQLAGFDVELDSEKVSVEMENSKVAQNISGGGTIRSQGTALRVNIDHYLPADHSDQEIIVYFSIQNSTVGQAVAANVERVFLASGAKKSVKPVTCKKLYLCNVELSEHWQEHIQLYGFSVSLSEASQIREITAAPPDFRGIAKKSDLPIECFIGPAVVPETGEFVRYIGLNYNDCRPRLNSSRRSIVNELDDIFTRLGARLVDFRPC